VDNLDATALAAETLELALHLAAATEDHDPTCRCLYALRDAYDDVTAELEDRVGRCGQRVDWAAVDAAAAEPDGLGLVRLALGAGHGWRLRDVMPELAPEVPS